MASRNLTYLWDFCCPFEKGMLLSSRKEKLNGNEIL